MANTTEGLTTQSLSLTEELILMLLNQETGYFHQVPGWHLNCAVVGAVLAELSLRSRIDTDMESLFLVDESENGRPRSGLHSERNRSRICSTERPVLDRTARSPCGIDH